MGVLVNNHKKTLKLWSTSEWYLMHVATLLPRLEAVVEVPAPAAPVEVPAVVAIDHEKAARGVYWKVLQKDSLDCTTWVNPEVADEAESIASIYQRMNLHYFKTGGKCFIRMCVCVRVRVCLCVRMCVVVLRCAWMYVCTPSSANTRTRIAGTGALSGCTTDSST